jgi:hypothetical protein
MRVTTMKRLLLLAIVPLAAGAEACCLPDAPEIGDIGPASSVVCRELEQRYPGADIKVTGRSIASDSDVAVTATIDGEALSLPYHLKGYAWELADTLAVAGTR